jgi:hypothetical protein
MTNCASYREGNIPRGWAAVTPSESHVRFDSMHIDDGENAYIIADSVVNVDDRV